MKRYILALIAILLLSTPVLAAQTSGQRGHVDKTQVRRELKDILSAREYNVSHNVNPVVKYLRKLVRTIGKAIMKFIAWIGKHLTFKFDKKTGNVVSFIAAWLAIVGFLVLAGLVIRWFIRTSGRMSEDEAGDGDMAYDLPSAKPLIREAQKLAEAGDYRGAFKAAYLASISHLDEIRALRFERSSTNWEYLRELKQSGHETHYEALKPLTLTFDKKIYGRETCAEDDYKKAAAVYERVSSGGES